MKKKFITLFLIIINVVFSKEIDVKKCVNPPVIDGRLDEECWKHTKLELVSNVMGESLFENTNVFLSYDEKNLYIGFECFESYMNEIKSVAKSPDDVWADDCVEIFMDTNNDEISYYHILINSNGLTSKNYNKKKKESYGWKGEIEVKTSKESNKWLVEVKIPFESLNKEEVDKKSWKMNFERERPAKSASIYEDSIWSPTWGDSHMVDKFGIVRFK
jgi:hypothetical protein